MQIKKLKSNNFFIKIKRGEEVIKSLTSICKEEKINGGFFFGVGAVDQVELAHYDVGKKKYSSLKFNQPLEMVNITGSIGKEKDLIIHSHAVFSDPQMKTVGGHLVEARVSGTAEIYLVVLPKLRKKYDQETGLKLFALKE